MFMLRKIRHFTNMGVSRAMVSGVGGEKWDLNWYSTFCHWWVMTANQEGPVRNVGASELVSVSLSLSYPIGPPLPSPSRPPHHSSSLYHHTSPLVCYGVREHTATGSNTHRKTWRTYVRTCESALSISWQSYWGTKTEDFILDDENNFKMFLALSEDAWNTSNF